MAMEFGSLVKMKIAILIKESICKIRSMVEEYIDGLMVLSIKDNLWMI